jgi:hypothetical protein
LVVWTIVADRLHTVDWPVLAGLWLSAIGDRRQAT